MGLGAALLIFLLVGTFAAGIAQAFQMVRTSTYKTLVPWSVFFCSHPKKLKSAKTQEKTQTQEKISIFRHFLGQKEKKQSDNLHELP